MNIQRMMTADVKHCSPTDTMDVPARIMWENDCGIVPVVDADRRVLGVVTDRDICMAALTQGRPLSEIVVESAASREVFAIRPSDSPQYAEQLMREKQVRRLVVVDDEGHVIGMLSLNDLARHSGKRTDDLRPEEVARTLAAICRATPITAPPS